MSSTTHGSPAIGILVADSNQTQRQLLVRALRQRPDLEISHCALEGDAILERLVSNPTQVLIMNLAHPRDGWQDMTVVRRVHLVRPEVAQVLLLDSYDRELVVNAFRSGARGLFCFAESPFRLLCKCIQSVHAGQIWANDQQLHYLIEAVTHVPSLKMLSSSGMKLLTPREEQVVALVADGLSNRGVAEELALSEHTIKKYLFRIFDKLGISSRVELVLYAVSNGGSRQAEWVAGARAS
jgi:DNA-binding NarL/FixJ family response regulator